MGDSWGEHNMEKYAGEWPSPLIVTLLYETIVNHPKYPAHLGDFEWSEPAPFNVEKCNPAPDPWPWPSPLN